jgi:hypothetical protein
MTTTMEGTTMRIHGNASGRSRLGMTLAAALAMALAACSGTSSTAAQTTATQQSSGTSSAPAASASTPAPAAATGLSGKWSGQYSGSSQGTFSLSWDQSGSALSGTIQLASEGSDMPVHGTVVGDSIRFGTVGSTGITYTGTVSGNSMSGRYQLVGNGTTFSGPWSASRSS